MGQSYRFGSLGTADGYADADGLSVLSYKDARRLALKSADAWRRVKPFRGADAPKVRYLSEDECRRECFCR